MASIKKTAKSLITDVRNAELLGSRGKAFRYDGQQYFVPHWIESDLISVKYSAKHKRVIIVTKEDFGGCGKDAYKPVIRPIEHWLSSHCTELSDDV